MWEEELDINEVREIRFRTLVFLGVGAIEKIEWIIGKLKKDGIDNILCITGGSSYKKTGAWDVVRRACKKENVVLTLYDEVTPNPTTTSIDEAVKIGHEFGAKGVLGIGGGSPIDTAKSVAALLANPGKNAEELYSGKFAPTKALPIIAINLTHGTGTEVDRVAVATIPDKNYKPAIAFECLYPLYSIDDPALMASLPPNQTRYVSIDAINHSVEAATSTMTNPLAIELAGECIRLVAHWLPLVEKDPGNLRGRYFLAYAAMAAGVAFDNGMLHYTHALEHPISAVKSEIAHGLGLSILLPAVLDVIYPARPKTLARILSPIVPGLRGTADEALDVAREMERWIARMGVSEKLADVGFTAADIGNLTKLVSGTPSLAGLLAIAPVSATPDVVARIYTTSMRPLA